MSSIDQIAGELLAIDSGISDCELILQRERGEIANTMAKAQDGFGDQQAGQRLVASLYKILQDIITADSSLHSARQGLHGCVQNIQK